MERDRPRFTRRQLLGGLFALGGVVAVLRPLSNFAELITNQDTKTPSPESPVDAIAVLGGGIERKNGKYVPSFDGKMRVMAAAEAYRKNVAPIVVFMGGKEGG